MLLSCGKYHHAARAESLEERNTRLDEEIRMAQAAIQFSKRLGDWDGIKKQLDRLKTLREMKVIIK